MLFVIVNKANVRGGSDYKIVLGKLDGGSVTGNYG